MQIRDIPIEEIQQGKNWKVLSSDEFDWENEPLENLPIAETNDFEPEDHIVYSAIFVSDAGDVTPLVMIKVVQDLDYWGDSCEYVNDRWKQVGLVPNPDAAFGTEYCANPLEQDDSFISDDDYREYHRKGFSRFVKRLT